MKEYRVFLDYKEIAEENGFCIDDWYEYEEQYGKLHPDAEIWIQDTNGSLESYCLRGFSYACERNIEILAGNLIYITNKY